MANMPVFRDIYRAAGMRPQVAGNDFPPSWGLAPSTLATAADP
jgi:hypothetical protein